MGTELTAKPSSKSAIAKSDTVADSKKLMLVMASLERDYRTEFSEAELQQWEALLEHPEKFSLREILAALDEVQLHPPAGWTGPPKRPDVLRQLFIAREEKAQSVMRERQKREQWEMRVLQEERAKHPERFISLADVLKGFKEQMGTMPSAEKSDEQRREVLERQKQELAEKYGAEKS